jgi:hypothetical protein
MHDRAKGFVTCVIPEVGVQGVAYLHQKYNKKTQNQKFKSLVYGEDVTALYMVAIVAMPGRGVHHCTTTACEIAVFCWHAVT